MAFILSHGGAIELLTKSVHFKRVSILKRKTADSHSIKQARELHRDLFSKLPKEDEDGLIADSRESFLDWQQELNGYQDKSSRQYYPAKSAIESAISRIKKQLAIRDSYEYIQSLISAREEWRDLAEDIHDISSFYTTQVTTWQRMLNALSKFEDNREILKENPQAANALKELQSIRDNPNPYGVVNRIDGLLASVENVNDVLSNQERGFALAELDKKIEEVELALDGVSAEADLRNKALYPLQQQKLMITELNSIPKIRYMAQQASVQLDEAMDKIASTQKIAPPPMPTGTSSGVKPVTVKSTGVVRAKMVGMKTYLETEEDVDAYLDKLKLQLLAVLKEGKKARIE